MKLGNRAALFLFLILWLSGCVNWKVKIEDDTEGWIVEMSGWYEFVP